MINNNIRLNVANNDNDFIYCWDKFGDKPNKINFFNNYTIEIDEYLLNISNSVNSTIDVFDIELVNERKFLKINDDVYISYTIINKNGENSFINNIGIFYKSQEDLEKYVNKIIEDIIDLELVLDNIESKLNTAFLTEDGFEIEPVEKIELDANIDAYYSKETLKSINQLVKTLKKTDKGISILYGTRGTGKTSLINHFCNKLDKKFVYIPNTMIEAFPNNDIADFLKANQDSILILDDCENILTDMYSKSNVYVSNIMQLLEGILSHSVKLNIITIFNTEKEDEICETLLNSNSLIDVINFTLLSEDESNNLSKTLNLNKVFKNKNRMIDVLKGRNKIVNKIIGL
jgi:hypothetical protein